MSQYTSCSPFFAPLAPLRRIVVLLLYGLAVTACIPPAETPYEGVKIDLNDPVSRRVYNHQNARNADSLRYYLTSANPSYRYLAARAFGSFPEIDEATLAGLAALLDDRDELIRSAAAWALGQSRQPAAADSLTVAFDGTGEYRNFNAEVLAGVGKAGDKKSQRFVGEISTYTTEDTLLLAGQLRALYNFALRELQSEAGDQRALATLLDTKAPLEVRRLAAWYLQRFEVAVTADQEEQLRQLLRTEQDADLLMGVVRTVGRHGSGSGRVSLIRGLRGQADWRVRVEILRALADGDYDYGSVREPVVEALRDKHPLVRRAAAEYLRDGGVDTDATFYRQLARDSTQTDIRYVLYAAAQRHLPLYFADYRGFLNYDLQQAYTKTDEVFERVEIIAALAEYPWNYRNIYELYQQTDRRPLRTAAAAALAKISQRADFDAFFKKSARRVRYELSTYFRTMIESQEVGPATEAGNTLANQADLYRPFYPETNWLAATLQSVDAPGDVDAYRAVDAARAALAGEPAPEPKPVRASVKPINWELIGTDSDEEIVVRTTAGRIVMKVWPDIAPATVSNFLELIKEGYYDGKVFHRVIPNFIAQGGGSTGDGYGVADFVVRTETPGVRFDRAGLIGMASAGKDTETVQFYFTHRATPHLNGGYTIFGAITEGQQVLDQVTYGTRIESISLR